MSNNKSTSKKRKRDHEQATVSVSSSAHTPGPLLAVYPAIHPPASLSFKAYAQKKPQSNATTNADGIIIAGETDQVEFITNEEESRRAAESGCRYIVALHNKRTGATSILPYPKPPHILQRTVKALKSAQTTDVPTTTQYQQARSTLGETFGTKKAKAALRAQERNRVDISAMEGVIDNVMEGIEKGAEGLMKAKEAKEATDNNRLIPPFSTAATEPDDIYPLHGIIPENEWKALSTSQFDGTNSHKERIALLPYSHSGWVNTHMNAWGRPGAGKNRKKNLKLLLYISSLFAFRTVAEKHNFNTNQIRERLTGLPDIVVDGLLARFTEKARDSTNHQVTNTTRILLLTNMFSICLKLDNFATNTAILSNDLSMSKDKVNQLFKSLGCKIAALGERERARLGISDTGDSKYASLTAPVKFPTSRTRRRN